MRKTWKQETNGAMRQFSNLGSTGARCCNKKERDKRVSRSNVNSLFELTEELCKSEEFLNKTTEASSCEAHWSAAKKQFDDEMWQDVETEEEKETATEYVGNKEMRMEGTKILREKKNKVVSS